MEKKTDSELYEALGKAIYESYTQGIFSRVLKSDIDIKVFHTFLLKNLDAGMLSKDGSINYGAVDKDAIYRLSLASGLTESAVQSKLETDFYSYRDKSGDRVELDVRTFLETQFVGLREGKVRLLVANPVVKKQLVNTLAQKGSVPDYSFNRDIVSIDVLDLLLILGMSDKAANDSLLEAVAKYRKSPEAKNDRERLEKVSQGNSAKETVKNILEYMGKTAYEKFLDAAYEAMFAALRQRL